MIFGNLRAASVSAKNHEHVKQGWLYARHGLAGPTGSMCVLTCVCLGRLDGGRGDSVLQLHRAPVSHGLGCFSSCCGSFTTAHQASRPGPCLCLESRP